MSPRTSNPKKSIIIGECYLNQAIGECISHKLTYIKRVRHCEGITKCIKQIKKYSEKKFFNNEIKIDEFIFLIDLENLEKSNVLRKYTLNKLKQIFNNCNVFCTYPKNVDTDTAYIIGLLCKIYDKIIKIIFLNNGPENLIERIYKVKLKGNNIKELKSRKFYDNFSKVSSKLCNSLGNEYNKIFEIVYDLSDKIIKQCFSIR